MSKTSRRKHRRENLAKRMKKAKNNRDITVRFLLSLGENMTDGERADLYRDLLMDYCFFSGLETNVHRQELLNRIAADYGRDAPRLGKDSAQDLLSRLQKMTK